MKKENSHVFFTLTILFSSFAILMVVMIGFWTTVFIILTSILIFLAAMTAITQFLNFLNKRKGKPELKILEGQERTDIVCDNPDCDFTMDTRNEIVGLFVNEPCPKCGENLLTQKDYMIFSVIHKTFAVINFVFGWVRVFYTEADRKSVLIGSVNGKITLKDK